MCMHILISLFSLLISVILLQLSSGGIGPLDALSGSALGFSTPQIGLMGSAHYLGFFIGCWWAPRLIGTVGYNRAFAVFTASGAIGALAHTLWDAPLFWAATRILSGLCIAGSYTVIEAWMNAKVTNEVRGRVFGTYRIVDLGASFCAQMVVGILPPASYTSYNILAILCCLAIYPLMLSKAKPPQTPPTPPRLQPIQTLQVSPLASAGVMTAGLTSAAFRMVGPIYGKEIGLNAQQIGLFLALCVLGGALAQIPIGWLADKFARRNVLFALAIASIFASWILVATSAMGMPWIYVASLIFGFCTFPLFSVSSALANDFARPEDMASLVASLMFLFAVGAIFSPYFAAFLMEQFGVRSLFFYVSLAHLGLAIFGIYRMRVRQAPEAAAPYRYTPRTSFLAGRLRNKQTQQNSGQE